MQIFKTRHHVIVHFNVVFNKKSTRNAHPHKSDSLHDIFISPDHELLQLNESLTILGESPVVKRKACISLNYSKSKVRSVEAVVKRKLELISGNAIEESEAEDSPDTEMIAQLKEKFRMSTKTSEKVQILTVLPRSWSIRKMSSSFKLRIIWHGKQN